MADAAVGFVLANLKQLLTYNYELISSVKDQIEPLCNDLRLLEAFVKDVTESRSKEAYDKELVRQIRITVYKIEDIIDMYVTYASFLKMRKFKKIKNIAEYPMKLRSVGKEIQNLRRLVESHNNKMFTNGVLNKKESTFIRSPPCVEEDNVVGFDKEAEMVHGWLMAEIEELEVISVVGMGGLGKTTLVKKVYNDPSIRYLFPIRSWVYVSQVYNRKDVFLKILYDVTRENNSGASEWSVEIIAEELRSKLEDESYLIVLDDVWTKQAWDDLKMVFPNTKHNSRILLTSRNKDVALHANTSLPPYQLRFLTDDESWELLENKAFLKGTRCPGNLENLGKQIARKCYGLPLAIVVIGGILKKKDKTRSWWEKVEEKVNTYATMESEQCMDVLALSYNHLPFDLKACFLYFGVFPEDFEIPVWKLLHIWVAEGFTQQLGDASAEEMAEGNLHDLVDRNLVLVEKRRTNGGIKTCRIHDMLHDMCVKQAEEENFFKEIKGLEASSCPPLDANIFRRVSVHSRVSDYISSKPEASHVRSFLSYSKEETVLSSDLLTYFPGSFNLLRVLDVLPVSFTRFPNIELVHLRYIALLGKFTVLPPAISNLWNLQTLIVKTKSLEIDVKVDLWKLLELRHVYTNVAIDLSSKTKKGVNDPLVNKNLRTMSRVSPDSCTDVILARTPNLQKLGVCGNLALLLKKENGTCNFNNFAKLSHLEKLKLLHDTYPNPPSEGKLSGLSECQNFPPKLRKITLSDTMLDWVEMSVLGRLTGLEVLKLGDNAFVGERWVTPDGSFVQLRVLQIEKTDLVHWEADGDQFPQLRRLTLKNCEQLVKIPSAIGGILTLEVMDLSRTSRLLVASAQLIQKTFKLFVFPPDHEVQT